MLLDYTRIAVDMPECMQMMIRVAPNLKRRHHIPTITYVTSLPAAGLAVAGTGTTGHLRPAGTHSAAAAAQSQLVVLQSSHTPAGSGYTAAAVGSGSTGLRSRDAAAEDAEEDRPSSQCQPSDEDRECDGDGHCSICTSVRAVSRCSGQAQNVRKKEEYKEGDTDDDGKGYPATPVVPGRGAIPPIVSIIRPAKLVVSKEQSQQEELVARTSVAARLRP
jgi:hypothetical protein